MRYPAEETAEKHRRILEVASRLFRERGFAAVSVGEIMAAAGLTHGPFYSHFASKQALIEESLDAASERALADIEGLAGEPGGWSGFVEGYLSEAHVGDPGRGCMMAALGPEMARGRPTSSVFTRHVRAVLTRLRDLLPGRAAAGGGPDPLVALSTMVGALVIARAVEDATLAQEILAAARGSLVDDAGGLGPKPG